jgi:UDPglucose 6-dehydrogenase
MKLSVVGLGKLGSPLLAVLANSGFDVIGLDLDLISVNKINAGIAPVVEPDMQNYLNASKKKIRATSDFNDAILNSDLTFVIVPTPSDSSGVFSNQFVLNAVTEIAKVLKNKNSYHIINITSTVMPGSCGGEILNAIEQYSGKRIGQDIGLCYNPEFIALGSVIKNMEYPDMCLIGEFDERSGKILEDVYKKVVKNKPRYMRMNLVNAELTKLAVNTYVTTKISYANMIADVCEKISGANAYVVCKAIGMDSRIGEKYLAPGQAFGGPCFPRDNQAYISLARSLGANASLASATKTINDYQIDKLINLIINLSSSGCVGFLGASYKPNTPVIEESATVKVIDRLLEMAQVVYVYDENARENLIARYGSNIAVVDEFGDLIQRSELVVSTLNDNMSSMLLNKQISPIMMGKKFLECWGSECREVVVSLGGQYYSLGSPH